MKLFTPALLLVCLFLGGCSTYRAMTNPQVNLRNYNKIFVINNMDDNHSIEIMLVQALREQGRDADSGPPTLVPEDAQAIISYQDQWSWDFSDHLVGLAIEMHDARKHQMIGTAVYSGPASMRTPPAQVVGQLVFKLLNKKPGKAPLQAPPSEPKK